MDMIRRKIFIIKTDYPEECSTILLAYLQLDDVQNQLQTEVEQKEKLDMHSRQIAQELTTLRSMEKSFNKVEKTKKRLEDDLAVYKVNEIGSYLALISLLRSLKNE